MMARAIALAVIALLPGASLPVAPRGSVPIDQRPLLALLQSLSRQPALLAFVQPGSIDDVVHVRSVLAGIPYQVRKRIAALSGPVLSVSGRPVGVYHLPVAGRTVIAYGEVSGTGIRSRGLTFIVPRGARVAAPAGGIVRYAQVFRGYGGTVIVDHGEGWTSLLTGLGMVAVAPGSGVRAGVPLGTAGRGAEPRITLELRHRGQPVEIAVLTG